MVIEGRTLKLRPLRKCVVEALPVGVLGVHSVTQACVPTNLGPKQKLSPVCRRIDFPLCAEEVAMVYEILPYALY